MKAFTDRDPRRIGIVAIAAVVGALGLVFGLNKSVFSSTYPVTARFTENAGLAPGDRVLVAGVPVGDVGSISQDGNHVEVSMNLNGGIKLPSDSSAAMDVQTLLGVVGVAIQPGSDWGHLLHRGSVIHHTQVPVELYQLQNTAGKDFGQTDVAALNRLVSTMAQITSGKQQQVHQIIDGLEQFTRAVDTNSSQLSALIDSASSLSGVVASRDSQLASALDHLDTVVSSLSSQSRAVGNLIDGIDQTASQTQQLVGSNGTQLDSMLSHLHSVLQVVNSHQLDLAQGISYLQRAVQGFASIGYSGPSNSPNPSWANTYVNLTGTFGIYGFIGPCGMVDQALNQALGPDPLACDRQTGPVPTYDGSPLPGDQSIGPRSASTSPAVQQAENSALSSLGLGMPGGPVGLSGQQGLGSLFGVLVGSLP